MLAVLIYTSFLERMAMMDSTIAIDHTLVEMVYNFGGWEKILILGGLNSQTILA